MNMHRLGLGLWGLSVLTCCAGCPFRKEKIVIARDGSVTMNLEYGGSPQEIDRFDALPSAETGWKTRHTVETETDSDGETRETVHIFAEQSFEPGESLPRRFVADDDPLVDLVLDFPTELRFEDRPDGRYLFFRRVYTPRRWAYADYWDGVFIDDEIKRLSEKDVETLTDDERLQILSALTALEAHRQIEFGREAMRSAFPGAPAAYFLLARQALLDAYEHNQEDRETAMERCAPLVEKERNACFEQASTRWLQDGRDAFSKVMQEQSGFDSRAMARFAQALDTAGRYYEITNELGGHAFEIEVTVPGEVIAHNGNNLKDDESGQTVTFEFDGRAFRDRTQEVIIVARVGKEK